MDKSWWKRSYLWLALAVVELALLLAGLFWSLSLPETLVGKSNCLSADGSHDDCYCEAFAKTGPFKERYNTLSALAFSVVGLFVAYDLARPAPVPNFNRMTSDMTFPLSYGCLAVFLGPGSMMFHASLSALGGFFDTFSMYNWLGWIIVYDAIRLLDIRRFQALVMASLYVAVVAAFTIAQQIARGGNAVFATQVVLAFVLEGLVFVRSRGVNSWRVWRWFIGAVAVFFAALGIWWLSWTGRPWCVPTSPLQGHAVWHAMSAVTVGLLYHYFCIAPDPHGVTYRVLPPSAVGLDAV